MDELDRARDRILVLLRGLSPSESCGRGWPRDPQGRPEVAVVRLPFVCAPAPGFDHGSGSVSDWMLLFDAVNRGGRAGKTREPHHVTHSVTAC
jgi:hypothetical protein